jgi:hypothetical protein
MAFYGDSQTPLHDARHRAREAAARATEAEASSERTRLQLDNERLRGDLVTAQQARDAAATAATQARIDGALEAATVLRQSQQAAAAPAPAPPPRDLSKLSPSELIRVGLEDGGRAAGGTAPAAPQPAAKPAQDLGKLAPTELIRRGLEADRQTQ